MCYVMVLGTLKKSLVSIVLASSLALSPITADAGNDNSRINKQFKMYTPDHIDWAFDNKDEARAIVLGVNMGFGCLKSGIGSYMHDKSFLEGCLKGAFAGAITYMGERIATFNDVPMVGGLGKLVHDLGVSMSDNVMRGESMLSQYQTEFGPVTFTFRDSLLPRISFTLRPAIAITQNFVDGQEFDFEKSLYNLTPVFKKSMDKTEINGRIRFMPGYSIGNVISYTPRAGERLGYEEAAADYDKMVFSHEFNHTLFWSKMRFCGDLLHWVPVEEIPLVPEMEEIELYWNIGQDLSYVLMEPFTWDRSLYYFDPRELEAYFMQRP